MADFLKLEKKIKVTFKNKELLQQALIHRSYINEHSSTGMEHNERLEFLGDAVLELIVTDYLYNNYPNPEGELTNWRAALVNAKILADIAKSLEIEDYLYMSKGEAKDVNPKARNYILANAMEAVIGAIYLDQGYDMAKEFITNNVLDKLPNILENNLYLDPKSRFQEKSQEIFSVTPNYRVLKETGPDHNKYFKMGVYIKNEIVAEGKGTSKQEAQMDAAKEGLLAKGWE